MLVDVHTHAFADPIADKAVTFLIDYYNIPTSHGGRLEDNLQTAAKSGVDVNVLLVAATKASQVRPANDWILNVRAMTSENLANLAGVPNPPRLIPFGTVHPDDPHFMEEFERLQTAGVQGIKLHPDFQGFSLNDPRLLPLFDAMGDTMVLMTHVGDAARQPDDPSTPRHVRQILKDFPHLRIIAAHMGGYCYWKEALDELAGQDVYMDLSSTLSFIPVELLHEFFHRHGTDRILFGSDYPLCSAAEELEQIDRLLPDLSPQIRDRIFFQNACELLQIK